MNRLASILPSAQVLVSVDATSKKRAFEEAGLLFESQHGLSRALITDSLFARERLGSTGLGHGVAIPHGRIKGLKAPMAAVFQLLNPIGFDAPDELPVGLLIFLLVPEAATQKHLEILSEIAELLSDSALRERLKACTDAAELRFDEVAVRSARSGADLVGYLNYIHPYRVQILGEREIAYLSSASPDDCKRRIARIVTLEPPVLVLADDQTAPDALVSMCERAHGRLQ